MAVHVHVLPRSGRTEVVGRHGDALKVRVRLRVAGLDAAEAQRRLAAWIGSGPG